MEEDLKKNRSKLKAIDFENADLNLKIQELANKNEILIQEIEKLKESCRLQIDEMIKTINDLNDDNDNYKQKLQLQRLSNEITDCEREKEKKVFEDLLQELKNDNLRQANQIDSLKLNHKQQLRDITDEVTNYKKQLKKLQEKVDELNNNLQIKDDYIQNLEKNNIELEKEIKNYKVEVEKSEILSSQAKNIAFDSKNTYVNSKKTKCPTQGCDGLGSTRKNCKSHSSLKFCPLAQMKCLKQEVSIKKK